MQVGIAQGHFAEFAFVTDAHGPAEPFESFGRFAELGGVAGEVVRDEPVFGELIADGMQGIPCFLAAFEFVKGVGAFDVAIGLMIDLFDQAIGGLNGFVPMPHVCVNFPESGKCFGGIFACR